MDEVRMFEPMTEEDLKDLLKSHPVKTVYYAPMCYYPENTNLHHGPFLFRHKGKRKKGKPNYPPTKLIVKTARKWRKSARGSRKLWKADMRATAKPCARRIAREARKAGAQWGKYGAGTGRVVIKIGLKECLIHPSSLRLSGKTAMSTHLFTGKDAVGKLTAKREPVVRER